MTNRIKGEVTVVAEDGPLAGEYVLVLDFNALCELEDDFPGIMQGEVEFKGFKPIRRLFRQCLAAYHPDLSDEDVGAIIHSIGVAAASEKLAEAMTAAFPEAATGKTSPRKARPSPGAGTAR